MLFKTSKLLLPNVQNSFFCRYFFYISLWNQQTMRIDNETNNSSVLQGFFGIKTLLSQKGDPQTLSLEERKKKNTLYRCQKKSPLMSEFFVFVEAMKPLSPFRVRHTWKFTLISIWNVSTWGWFGSYGNLLKINKISLFL